MTHQEEAQAMMSSGGAAHNAIIVPFLENLGLRPTVSGDRITTGINGLVIEHLETQMATMPTGGEDDLWFVSWETRSFADGFPVPDLVTMSGNGPRETLEKAVRTWLAVTFPALRGLCDPDFLGADRQIQLASLTGGEFLDWKVFTGEQQFSGDGEAALRRYFAQNPDFFLVMNTVTGFLSQKRPHFIKIFLRFSNGQNTFGCSIDGQKSPEAEAEIASKLAGQSPDIQPFQPEGDVEFRVFFALRPTPSAPDPELQQKLEEQAQQQARAPQNRGLRWPWKR
jgi:hypothetical protein